MWLVYLTHFVQISVEIENNMEEMQRLKGLQTKEQGK